MTKKKTTTTTTTTSDQARFGWSTGQLSVVNDDGSKTRLGPISPEDQKMIDKLKAERNERGTWREGDIQIIRKGSGGPLISEKELNRILADRPDRIKPATTGRK